jgi:K+-sensing histidine kinase KdpD
VSPGEVEQAVSRRQATHEEELLAQSEPGQKILQLQTEKENLLDTVWLATSPAHVRQLWSKVAELLGNAPTRLEQDALAIEVRE